MSCRGSRFKFSRSAPRPAGTAGFTLIEVLVAIAVLAVVLGAIGAVVGTTVKGIRSADRRLPLLETARSLLASLPARDALQPGTQTGTAGDFRWRIDTVALPQTVPDSARATAPDSATAAAATMPKWLPLAITVRVQGGDGPPVRLDTVRLVPRPAG